jgi:DNA damage-inducible protein 1
MEMAIENLPEGFGQVTMLYVNIEVNNLPIKAFVDSGAQSTIMSLQCAERCGITRLMDTRFAGQARGVGTAKILGRIHIAQMKFGRSFFPISITVLENNDVDFLFGLDMLRRYRCNIDLSKNVLSIEGATGREEISFLSENELPESAKVGASK